MMYRIDRADGSKDRYCGLTNHFKPQPCSQYVKDGDRYIHYPETDECCYCCSAPYGCGVLSSNWMTDATYVGTATINGIDTF